MRLASEGDDRLSLNYKTQRLALENQSAFSVAYCDGTPYMAATIWQRDCFPRNTARIFNRFYKIPETRDQQFSKKVSQGILELAKQQIQTCNNLGFEYAFVSRPQNRRRSLLHVVEVLSQVSPSSWEVPEDLFLVCPDRACVSCWQLVAYTKLGRSADPFGLESQKIKLRQQNS